MTVSDSWSTVPLGDVLKLYLDAVPATAGVEFQIAGVYSFGRGLFARGALDATDTTYKCFHRLHTDDYVISRPKAWEGALARIHQEFDGWFLSPVFPTFRAVSERLDIRFLEWYCRQSCVWERLRRDARGMGARRESVSPEQFLSLTIPLPPLSEQRRIVAKIEQLAAKIEEARGLQSHVGTMSDQLCRSLLRDNRHGEPTPTPMHQLVTWRKPDVQVMATESYRFAGVYCFGRGVFRGDAKSGLEFSYKQLTQLRAREFVYPKLMAWEGALAVVPPECEGLYVSPEFPVFTVHEDRVLPEVLDVHFRSPSVWPLLSGTSTGTNVRRRRLNPKDFLAFDFPLPSHETQLEVRAVKAKVDQLKELQAKTAAELDALLPSILDKAFKGEL